MLRKLSFVLALLLCLTGCSRGKDPVQKPLDFRMKLMQAGVCSFTAEITADVGGKIYDFSVAAEHTPECTVLTVLEPEEIAGISATVSDGSARLEFDGLELELGSLAGGNVTPMAVPWLLAQCWAGEYISASGADGDLERVTYLRGYDDKELTVDTWFDEALIPVYAEIAYDGLRCVQVQIKDFHL